MEVLINREVERLCRLAVRKSQELNSDVFGFGDKIHIAHPQVWREIQGDWRQIYPTIKVDIKADFTVEHVGLFDQPIEVK